MTEHILKLNEIYFDAVADGTKTFEVRRNDRNYQVGDILVLCAYDPKSGQLITYRNELLRINKPVQIRRAITYVLTHEDFPDGIKEGYAVLGLRPA